MAENTSKIKNLFNNVRLELEMIITKSEQENENMVTEQGEELSKEIELEFLNAQLELLDTFIKVIETYAKKSRLFDNLELFESREDWLHLLNYAKRMQRKEQLLKPRDQGEFTAALMWMSQHGNEKELEIIREVCKNPPFNSEEIQRLFVRVQQTIEARLFPEQQPKKSEIYQIFCSEVELRELLPDIEIIENYQAFVFIEVDEETMVPIKNRYPVEKLAPQSLQESGENSMPKKEQVVKFRFPVRQDWKKRIEDTDEHTKILQPLGNSEFVVSIPNANILDEIKKFREVASVTPYEPTIRVQEKYLEELRTKITAEMLVEAQLKLIENPQDVKSSHLIRTEITAEMLAEAQLKLIKNPQDVKSSHIIPGILIASFFTEEDCNQAEKVLESHGIDIVDRPDINELIVDLIDHSDPIAAYEIIKQLPGLTSLEEETLETTCNYHATHIIVNGTSPINPIRLTGKGEIIAIADTGLDLGEKDVVHPDFEGRVRAIKSFPIRETVSRRVHNPEGDDGASDKYSGHGTHVAGSALGSGQAAQNCGLPPIRGIAHEAELIFQAVEQTVNWTNRAKLLSKNNGEILSASNNFLGIPRNLQKLFEFAYENGARIHSNSWGGNHDGSYNDRSIDLDEFVHQNKDFLVVCAAGNGHNQPKSISPPGTAKNCITVGTRDEFSSQGPCQGGRRKPDVIAPGKYILSTRSRQIEHYSEAPYPLDKKHYMYSSGTSMATPLVAGSAALVRQYLRNLPPEERIDQPSAALLKAALIHSAEYIRDRNGHTEWADNKQGWGRVTLSRIIDLPSPHQIVFFDQSQGFSNPGDHHKYQLEITDSSIPLRITLVYTDYPGERLVNNLNLFVYQSSSQQWYVGNDFVGPININNDSVRDKVNNVEGCIIELPETGLWEIKIVGSEINESPQDYALVVSGAFVGWQQLS